LCHRALLDARVCRLWDRDGRGAQARNLVRGEQSWMPGTRPAFCGRQWSQGRWRCPGPGFCEPRPSGPPSATQRRASSVVAQRKRGGLRPRCSCAGGLQLSRESRPGAPFPWSARQHYCARRDALPDGRSGTIECPARPGGACIPRVLGLSRPLTLIPATDHCLCVAIKSEVPNF